MSMIESTSRSQLQRECSFYCSRGKVYKGSCSCWWKGLIGHNTAPNYDIGGRKEECFQKDLSRVIVVVEICLAHERWYY